MSDTYEKVRRIDHLIRKEQSNRDKLVSEDLNIGFYDRDSRQQAMCDSINHELELREKKRHLHKKPTGRHPSTKERHYLMEKDKKRLEPHHSSHGLDKFYALVELVFVIRDIQDLKNERLYLIVGGKYQDKDDRGISRVVETILEEMTARNEKQMLEKETQDPGSGTEDKKQKTRHELLKETFKEGVSALAEQDGWTTEKAHEAYGHVKQALVG